MPHTSHARRMLHRSNETVFVTEANQCQLSILYFLFSIFSLLFTWHIALKWKQQFIYNKINGRQIVSTVIVFFFLLLLLLFCIACVQTTALVFSWTSAKCLEANNKRMKESWERKNSPSKIHDNKSISMFSMTGIVSMRKPLVLVNGTVFTWKSGIKSNFIIFNTFASNLE